jgi:hypothetical protein
VYKQTERDRLGHIFFWKKSEKIKNYHLPIGDTLVVWLPYQLDTVRPWCLSTKTLSTGTTYQQFFVWGSQKNLKKWRKCPVIRSLTGHMAGWPVTMLTGLPSKTWMQFCEEPWITLTWYSTWRCSSEVTKTDHDRGHGVSVFGVSKQVTVWVRKFCGKSETATLTWTPPTLDRYTWSDTWETKGPDGLVWFITT